MIDVEMNEQAHDICFQTELRPNCSGSARAVNILGVLLALVFAPVGLIFAWLGAWPVFGFMGIEALALYGLLRLHHRLGERREIVALTERELVVEEISPWGRRRTSTLPRPWLQVSHQTPANRPGHVELRSHGRTVRIGGFLSAEERQRVADSLRRALAESGVVQSNPSTFRMV